MLYFSLLANVVILRFQLVNGFRDEKEEALRKVAEVEGRLKETETEKEKSTTKLLNLRKNAGKLLRVIQEVS